MDEYIKRLYEVKNIAKLKELLFAMSYVKSQKELADKLNMSASTVSRIFSNDYQKGPQVKNAEVIVDAFCRLEGANEDEIRKKLYELLYNEEDMHARLNELKVLKEEKALVKEEEERLREDSVAKAMSKEEAENAERTLVDKESEDAERILVDNEPEDDTRKEVLLSKIRAVIEQIVKNMEAKTDRTRNSERSDIGIIFDISYEYSTVFAQPHIDMIYGIALTEENYTSIESAISAIHAKNWKKRPKAFKELDRIALFQFRIDSSYLPPEMEVENNRKDDTYLPSYAEYRRRKLLRPVLNACNEFGVEILLLPEYSIRPETVVWMCKYLEEKRYTFSIWAGTFKIPAGYRFQEDYWEMPKKEILNSDIYCHSAPLPIIMNDLDKPGGGVCIVARKVKKYPAVALREEINPVPAINQMKDQNSFRPIVDWVRGTKGINVDVDARKDVTELICAETFAVSNITNYPSFLQASMEAYYKYAKKNSAKPIKKFKKIMLEDIMEFGNSTAIFSLKERKHRSSIVLIPACSSRAVDYYVIGQGNYLAAGLKMVFCNSVDDSARGGSCFIGQNSWDDARLRRGDDEKDRQKQDILTENTYYHGLCPGIYQQSSRYRDRGALGKEEQALLICDVLPNEQNKPTAESSMSSLTVVAHIPIFEVDSTKDIQKTEREHIPLTVYYTNQLISFTLPENTH